MDRQLRSSVQLLGQVPVPRSFGIGAPAVRGRRALAGAAPRRPRHSAFGDSSSPETPGRKVRVWLGSFFPACISWAGCRPPISSGSAGIGLRGEVQATGGGRRRTGQRGSGQRLFTQRAGGGAPKGAARQGEGGGRLLGGVKACKAAGLEPITCPSQRRDDGSGSADGEAGAPRKAARTCAKRGNACQGGRARGEVCGMAPRLARGSKRRAWTLTPQRRQYELNHLRHRAEKRGLSGGDGRRGACEWSCEATVHAWRVSSAAWSAPCRRGIELV